MLSVIDLDHWTLHPLEAPDGSPAAALPASIAARVPGTVHTDLLAAGLLADPYLDTAEADQHWIGHTRWAYRTTLPALELAPGERVELAFDGLDTVATVRLNGVVLGRTANQHRRYRFEVGALLGGGDELEVVFDSAWAYAEALRDRLGELPNAYPSPFNFIRKMAANFGWDWGPQLLTAGLWRPARLERWRGARLRDVRLQVTLAGADGVVDVSAEALGELDGLRVAVAVAGVRTEVPAGGADVRARVRVPGPELWWPVGLGAQPLYPLRVSLLGPDGHELDAVERRIGFRSVALDTTPDADGTPFTFVINGRPIVIRGANWIPDDCFPSRVGRERYRERIDQALGARLNLLRVWGGGVYEDDAFYELCDERGLLVWQDFLFACAAYPEEEPIAGEVAAEARDNVARLAGHPSLVLWNGNNENIWGYWDWGWAEALGGRGWGLGYYTGVLPEIVAGLDPATPYWPGSPYSGRPDRHPNADEHGNCHYWDVWNHRDYTAYAEHRPRFASEFGFQGPPTWSTLTESIHDDPLTPQSPGMLAHQKAEDGQAKLARGLAPHLPEPRSMADWHYLTQLNQARAVAFGVEAFRAARPRCMGTIVWQLNDCWPVTSWAAIDGYGRRKPLWHALRRVNAERLATLQPGDEPAGLRLVLLNDGLGAWSCRGELHRMTLAGELRARSAFEASVDELSQAAVAVPAELATPSEPANEVLVVLIDGRAPLVRPFVEDRDLALSRVTPRVRIGAWADGRQTVELSAEVLVRGACLFVDRLVPEAWVEDADVDLLPRRPVSLTVHSPRPLEGDELSGVLRTLNDVASPPG